MQSKDVSTVKMAALQPLLHDRSSSYSVRDCVVALTERSSRTLTEHYSKPVLKVRACLTLANPGDSLLEMGWQGPVCLGAMLAQPAAQVDVYVLSSEPHTCSTALHSTLCALLGCWWGLGTKKAAAEQMVDLLLHATEHSIEMRVIKEFSPG